MRTNELEAIICLISIYLYILKIKILKWLLYTINYIKEEIAQMTRQNLNEIE